MLLLNVPELVVVAEGGKGQSNMEDGGLVSVLFGVETLLEVSELTSSSVCLGRRWIVLAILTSPTSVTRFSLILLCIWWFRFNQTLFLRLIIWDFLIRSTSLAWGTRILVCPLLTWECVSHDGKNTILQREDCAEIEEKSECALPCILLRVLERLAHYFAHLWVKVQISVIGKYTQLILNVMPSIVLLKLHVEVPINGEAVLSEGLLDLLWVEEVEVGAEEFTPTS